jgi:hypothetical protein
MKQPALRLAGLALLPILVTPASANERYPCPQQFEGLALRGDPLVAAAAGIPARLGVSCHYEGRRNDRHMSVRIGAQWSTAVDPSHVGCATARSARAVSYTSLGAEFISADKHARGFAHTENPDLAKLAEGLARKLLEFGEGRAAACPPPVQRQASPQPARADEAKLATSCAGFPPGQFPPLCDYHRLKTLREACATAGTEDDRKRLLQLLALRVREKYDQMHADWTYVQEGKNEEYFWKFGVAIAFTALGGWQAGALLASSVAISEVLVGAAMVSFGETVIQNIPNDRRMREIIARDESAKRQVAADPRIPAILKDLTKIELHDGLVSDVSHEAVKAALGPMMRRAFADQAATASELAFGLIEAVRRAERMHKLEHDQRVVGEYVAQLGAAAYGAELTFQRLHRERQQLRDLMSRSGCPARPVARLQ